MLYRQRSNGYAFKPYNVCVAMSFEKIPYGNFPWCSAFGKIRYARGTDSSKTSSNTSCVPQKQKIFLRTENEIHHINKWATTSCVKQSWILTILLLA